MMRELLRPNQSPEPTAVGAVSSAVAVPVADRRWLSFFVRCHSRMDYLKLIRMEFEFDFDLSEFEHLDCSVKEEFEGTRAIF